MSGRPLGEETDEDWPLLRRFKRYGLPHAHLMAAGLVAVFVGRMLGMATPFVLGVTFDALFNDQVFALPLVPQSWVPTEPMPLLYFAGAVLGTLYVAGSVAGYANNVLRGLFGIRLQHDLRVDAFDRVVDRELGFFEGQQTGEVMSVLNSDVNTLGRFFRESVAYVLHDLGTLFWAGAFMAMLNWRLALLAYAVGPLVVLANRWWAETIEGVEDRVRQAVGELNARLADSVNGIAVVKASATEPFESARVHDSSHRALRRKWSAQKLRAGFYPAVNLLTDAGYLAVFVVGGLWVLEGAPLGLGGAVTAGQMVPFVLYTRELMWPFQSLGRQVDTYKSARASAKRVAALENADDPVEDDPDAVDLEDVDGHVEYEGVTFGYGDEPVLEGVSADIPAGATVGVVGKTGAGKSTFVKLLPRFYDVDDGAVRVDGHDVREVTRHSLRSNVGYVSQDPFLFGGTVRENVAYGDPDATDTDIEDAVRAAGAHEFVAALPDGYDTEVGQRGVKLSGGQRQRLAMARALVGDPPLMVLDEATSHVDTETEMLIQASLQDVTADRTTFVVAHRLSTVRDADVVLVFEDGEIVERGTHEELLDRDGRYADLWAVQVGEVATPDG